MATARQVHRVRLRYRAAGPILLAAATFGPAVATPIAGAAPAAVHRASVSPWVYQNGVMHWPGDYSYSAAIDYADTAGVAPGGHKDIAVSLTGPWGAWQPYAPNWDYDDSSYRDLTFELKPTVAGQQWSVQFIKVGDVPVGISLDVADYGPAPVPGRWARYTVPLTALGVADQPLYKFAIQDQTGRSANTWYVTRVGFVR